MIGSGSSAIKGDPLPSVKVSILMPFKNTSDYLEECLESMVQQSYEQWELLAVDDHSKDHSAQIVKGFDDKDPRIRLLKNQGHGIIPALRTAWGQAGGQMVTRMDSDDIMLPEKLEHMSRDLGEHGPGHVALGQVKYFSSEGISEGYLKYENWINQLTETGDNYSEIYKECVIPSPCWMVHRTDLEACNAFNPDRYPEDYDLTFRFREQGLQCLPSSKILHMWRDYPSRTSRTSEHYAQNSFLELKVHYFLQSDYDAKRPLTVWGAGEKGKKIARLLQNRRIPYYWLCDNPRKIGKKIYGQTLHHYQMLETLAHPQSIITVANPSAQGDIRRFLRQLGLNTASDYFFFC